MYVFRWNTIKCKRTCHRSPCASNRPVQGNDQRYRLDEVGILSNYFEEFSVYNTGVDEYVGSCFFVWLQDSGFKDRPRQI